jgi:2-oxoisovalerate dehydrogenase E1 component
MVVSRASILEANFRTQVSQRSPTPGREDLDSPARSGTSLTGRQGLEIYIAQCESRICDFLSRELKTQGQSFYTIASSGHEGNAAVGHCIGLGDISFLHYRSGGYFMARANRSPGPEGAFDVLLGMVASRDEPIAGGRHKVFGSVPLHIPPQTSTIASHLPKALGCAVSLDRKARLENRAEDRITICSFGDASSNHSTATGAINAACWASFQRIPAPVLFVCEDNGLGISVRTPTNWIAANYRNRAGMSYFHGDGLDVCSAWDAAKQAISHVRETRTPAFLHLSVVRLLGHAGSDVEQLYRSQEEIEASEANDPLLQTAFTLIDNGWLSPEKALAIYDECRERLGALADEAVRRPKITTAQEVMEPLFLDNGTAAQTLQGAPPAQRSRYFGKTLPEASDRARHMAIQINRALADIMLERDETVLFGEDVARKGGVYHVTADLSKKFGVGRVFNTLLDEQTILGLAIGAGHAEMLPFPEIQYLAYLINAIDQLRGEAGSMQFFSKGQYGNPMVVRIAALAYQKGFGGHFHNDNGIAALREIPGLLIACPSRGADAARMLRTLTSHAIANGRVTVFMEPIALYMERDLYEAGDGLWQDHYPAPDESIAIGEVGLYGEGSDLCIASYGNGLRMSLRVARKLEELGVQARVVDIRWLLPLPLEAIEAHAAACGHLLIVDECRASSGVADPIAAHIAEVDGPKIRCSRVVAPDTYIPLGDAANLVLVQEETIYEAAVALIGNPKASLSVVEG